MTQLKRQLVAVAALVGVMMIGVAVTPVNPMFKNPFGLNTIQTVSSKTIRPGTQPGHNWFMEDVGEIR